MKRLFLISVLVATPALAGEFPEGAHVCVTKDALSELYAAVRNKDARQYRALRESGRCVNAEGVSYSVVSRNLSGKTKVRIYKNGSSAVGWTGDAR